MVEVGRAEDFRQLILCTFLKVLEILPHTVYILLLVLLFVLFYLLYELARSLFFLEERWIKLFNVNGVILLGLQKGIFLNTCETILHYCNIRPLMIVLLCLVSRKNFYSHLMVLLLCIGLWRATFLAQSYAQAAIWWPVYRSIYEALFFVMRRD